MRIPSILGTLYEHHYKGAVQFSEVARSHWREAGWHKVSKTPLGWKREGRGFGSRRKGHFATGLVKFPSEIQVGRQLRRFSYIHHLIELDTIASMQEMYIYIAQSYLQLTRHDKSNAVHFYCCNCEENPLSDGTTTRYDDYGWHAVDWVLADESCPWLDSHSTNFPPQWKKFDGPFRHRLSQLAQNSQ